MHNISKNEKGDLSTSLSYEKEKTCRTLSFSKNIRQAPLAFDTFRYHIMPNNLFAFKDVCLATSSKDIPFISAICSATNFTYAGSFLLPL